ncbi:DUF1579 family protein [Rhodanobacter lindaniclasticus]
MKRTSLAIFTATVCTFAAIAIAQAAASQTSASSPLSQLDRLVGDGTCIGHQFRDGKTPGPTTTGRAHGEKTLDGHWIVVRYEQDQSVTNPRPYTVMQYFGYDRARKQFVSVALANSTGNYYVGISPGWKGTTITFDQLNLTNGRPASFRDVFTASESGMASHTGLRLDKQGKWIKTDVETCHKA